ncbi:class I SAM-dependent methyltransferase [Diaphorobacter sp.]|uniref:class I SAM-dependent methyltransferase n=1 Tax=Diaphorobacter sp. TaxID=1934310 RepID=UPI0028AC5461|nr:class I SAM-dependent methyltransferase [Diaphorobacter sp.]
MPDTISPSPSHSVLSASDWVRRWSHLVPPSASVLDVACGTGRHMQWFAGRGHTAIGVDRSPEAEEAARQFGEVLRADVENGPWPLAGRRFDAVVVTNYLWRPLFPHLLDSVAPGGVLIYETFAIGNESVGRPARPEFLLQPGELLTLCSGLRVIAYEDGFLPEPARFVQRIVARRETSPSTEVFQAQLCAPV